MEDLPIPSPTIVVRAASSRGDFVKEEDLPVPPTPGGSKGMFTEAVFS